MTARISPKKTEVFRAEYGVFNCQVTGDPLPTVTWYNNGNNIMKDSRSKIKKIPGGFMIRYGQLYRAFHHHGNISCKASNGVDPPTIDTAILNVLSKYLGTIHYLHSSILVGWDTMRSRAIQYSLRSTKKLITEPNFRGELCLFRRSNLIDFKHECK